MWQSDHVLCFEALVPIDLLIYVDMCSVPSVHCTLGKRKHGCQCWIAICIGFLFVSNVLE